MNLKFRFRFRFKEEIKGLQVELYFVSLDGNLWVWKLVFNENNLNSIMGIFGDLLILWCFKLLEK